MTSFADLGAWLPRSGKWCFLVGSGISLPAGIPSVSTFLPTFFMHLWPAAQARLCEFAAMGPHGTVDRARLISRLNAGQYLRFEGVMAAVSRHVSAADYTQLLQCFDHSTPARAHRLLATLLDRDEGHTVFTTNFDTLIERARQPSKACVAVNEAEYQSTETGLFKLHGTVGRWNATAQTVDPAHSEERPAASIDEVGQIRHSHSKRKRFLQVLANSEIVVVAGYSAGDVFDITAWLKESRPQKLLWIDHAATSVHVLRGTPLQSELAKPDRSIAAEVAARIDINCISQRPETVWFAHGDTKVVWQRIASALVIPPDGIADHPADLWTSVLTDWFAGVDEDQRKWLVAAICAEAGETQFALTELLNHALVPSEPDAISQMVRDHPARAHLCARLLLAHERAVPGQPIALPFATELQRQTADQWRYFGLVLEAQILQQQRTNRQQAFALLEKAQLLYPAGPPRLTGSRPASFATQSNPGKRRRLQSLGFTRRAKRATWFSRPSVSTRSRKAKIGRPIVLRWCWRP
jgi:hypothetical protein